MSPAAITQEAPASASPSPTLPKSPNTRKFYLSRIWTTSKLIIILASAGGPKGFDDIFSAKFFDILEDFKNDPNKGPLTQDDRKRFIDSAYEATDAEFFGNRVLNDHELKMRAMTKVFYKVLAEEPWTDTWIRPSDVERKLSRFEMHKDSVELAAKHGWHSVREAVAAARQHLIELGKLPPEKRPGLRGPFDDIEVIYIPGTVSSSATSKIDRNTIYPVSVLSVANILHNHICREMVKPYEMAEMFVTCTDTEELMKLRQFACDVVDFAPHLLDNDNASLLLVLLILARSEITRRFENNGIRIEGSTISHRRAECLKTKLGWQNAEARKPFDNVSTELQTRVKNACFPSPRNQRGPKAKTARKSAPSPMGPPLGMFPPPFVGQHSMPLHQHHLMQVPHNPRASLPLPVAQANGDKDAMDLS